MKTLPLLALFITTSIFAQVDIDIREANEQTEQQIRPDKTEVPRKRKEGYFAKTFSFKSKLPKARKLDGSEKIQKELIQCVEKIISERKGGDKTLLFAQKVLLSSFEDDAISRRITILEKAKNECTRLSFELISGKKETTDFSKVSLLHSTDAEIITNRFVKNLSEKKESICTSPGIRVQAGMLVALGTGIVELKCLLTNGQVRNYLGIEISGAMGGGASLRLGNGGEDEAIYSESAGGVIGTYTMSIDEESGYTQLPIGALGDGDHAIRGASAGIGIFAGTNSAGAGIRIFNGKRRWGWLIDQLK